MFDTLARISNTTPFPTGWTQLPPTNYAHAVFIAGIAVIALTIVVALFQFLKGDKEGREAFWKKFEKSNSPYALIFYLGLALMLVGGVMSLPNSSSDNRFSAFGTVLTVAPDRVLIDSLTGPNGIAQELTLNSVTLNGQPVSLNVLVSADGTGLVVGDTVNLTCWLTREEPDSSYVCRTESH